MRLYINGVEANSADMSGNSFSGYTPLYYYLGRTGQGTTRFFNGILDDVRIYNRALSETEIQELCDSDGNTVPDYRVNCPNTANPSQQDCDGDGAGDFCDPDTIYGHVSGDMLEDVFIDIKRYSPCGFTDDVGTASTDSEGYYAYPVTFRPGDGYITEASYDGCSFEPSDYSNITIPRTEHSSHDFTATCE